ncbi:MAG: glycosyltransferase family 1 protein [Bacteroidia bacterium]
MTKNGVHIVCFDRPFPPNYGGSMDMYFKLKALVELGAEVILHVFLYDGKTASPELESLCRKVYYYERRRFKNPFLGDLPYVVITRDDERLLYRLRRDKYPVLFEGLHSTFFLNHFDLKQRVKVVRAHNVEHHYYSALEEAENSFFKKYFFRIESERLKAWESILKHAQAIAAISPIETQYFEDQYGKTSYIPAFHPNHDVQSPLGCGDFVLYHGNLAVPENNRAALYLVREVFSKLTVPCVVAGNHPSSELQTAVQAHEHIELKANIGAQEVLDLVASAQVNALVTFQSTGIKLKLLNSLHRGRHCVVNGPMIDDTGLGDLCHTGRDAQALVQTIENLWKVPFEEAHLSLRRERLSRDFDNATNARNLAELLGLELGS